MRLKAMLKDDLETLLFSCFKIFSFLFLIFFTINVDINNVIGEISIEIIRFSTFISHLLLCYFPFLVFYYQVYVDEVKVFCFVFYSAIIGFWVRIVIKKYCQKIYVFIRLYAKQSFKRAQKRKKNVEKF